LFAAVVSDPEVVTVASHELPSLAPGGRPNRTVQPSTAAPPALRMV
jgi:hypothetical protein